ncbi:MAG: hypothetical protein JSV81_01125 [Anaerolineales bacterium]|nr:MAG: hypothetical protein JSV81_01125 [Anaerolineales bacterium]
MNTNYEWQQFHTRERIEARLREAETYRLARQSSQTVTFQILLSQISHLAGVGVTATARTVIGWGNAIQAYLFGSTSKSAALPK